MISVRSARAMAFVIVARVGVLMIVFGICDGLSTAQGIASIQNISSTPFVTGVTPVIGSNGAVGGVLVDAHGVVSSVEHGELLRKRATWKDAVRSSEGMDLDSGGMRIISLARLDKTIASLLERDKPLTQETIFLAGLQRVQYVVAVPEWNDILIAGPAGDWKANDAGEVVSTETGYPVLRLDDLMDALRSQRQEVNTKIHCSIEPTPEGNQRYAKVRSRIRSFNEDAIRAMEQSLGAQQVLIGGVSSDSHFARVLVSADYVMKRLAMGFEPAPVDSMSSFLDLVRKHAQAVKLTSPRWWMATNYEPMRCSSDRLCWQIRGQGVKVLTEDSLLDAGGNRRYVKQENDTAIQWAESMTASFNELSVERPIFGELRNCFDLSVVGALIASEGLAVRSDCEFSVLLDPSRLRGPVMHVPSSVPSKAAMIRGRRGWIVSVSGGVEIDPWSVVNQVETTDALDSVRDKAIESRTDRWWW